MILKLGIRLLVAATDSYKFLCVFDKK